MKLLIYLSMLLPTVAFAEGKIGFASLIDQDQYAGNRSWINIYEPVVNKFHLGFYGQYENGPQNSGNNLYIKLGGFYDLTDRLNISVFKESVNWTSPNKTNSFDSQRVGVGVEYKLWQ